MMPLASECCKCCKLLVDLFVQKLYKPQLNFKKLNCCYYSYVRLSECITIVDNNQYVARVYNDAIGIIMLQMLKITCGFVTGFVQKLYKAQLTFRKLNYCYYSYVSFSECVTVMENNQQLARVYNDAVGIRMLQLLQITCGSVRTEIVLATIEF